MTTQILSGTISLLIGSVIMINGVTANVADIMADAKASVNGANVHQLATALEIYYSDHNAYPIVSDADELVNKLESEGYIENRPLDPNVFVYEIKDNGQNYSLALAK